MSTKTYQDHLREALAAVSDWRSSLFDSEDNCADLRTERKLRRIMDMLRAML